MQAKKNTLAENAYTLCLDAVQAAGYELLEVKYGKEQGEYYLTFIIDKRGGTGIEDCERVNDIVDPLLETANLVQGAYNLEVSSAGLDRLLQTEADFKRYLESEVEISCYRKFLNCKQFIGFLLDYADGKITLGLDLLAMQKRMDKKNFKDFLFNIELALTSVDLDKLTEAERQTLWRKFKPATLLEREEPIELNFAETEWSQVKRYIDF